MCENARSLFKQGLLLRGIKGGGEGGYLLSSIFKGKKCNPGAPDPVSGESRFYNN